MMKTALFLLLISAALISCSPGGTAISEGAGIITEHAMMVSAYPDASRIGAEIMSEGGNAIDAAVATGFALAVSFPAAGNIGGGGFMIIRMADGTSAALDFREKAPAASHRDMFLDAGGDVTEGLSLNTHLGAGVPGTVDGLITAHTRYGKMPWKKLIQPAIDLARNGYLLSEREAASLNSMRTVFLSRNSGATAFVKEGEWKKGDTLRQPDLALTLERIRDYGREGFYEGKTAEMIVNECRKGNGIITYQDLSEYRSVWRTPIVAEYKGYEIISMPPPSSGGVALLQLLGMTESYGIDTMGFHTPQSIHLMIEAERRVYADRAEFMGDPDYADVPVAGLLNSEYLSQRMSGYDMMKATPSSSVSHGSPQFYESEETTHYSVADQYGNAVACTTTLNNSYGSAIVTEGAGFLLNNEMDDFSSKPGVPNLFGLTGGEYNEIQPGKRMLSSMTPTIISRNGKLFMVVGSPGGSTIITSVFQVILNVVDFDMDISAAVNAGRFHHQWLPDRIDIESGRFDTVLIDNLKHMGYNLSPREPIGRVDAILVSSDGLLKAGADMRGDDTAAGF